MSKIDVGKQSHPAHRRPKEQGSSTGHQTGGTYINAPVKAP